MPRHTHRNTHARASLWATLTRWTERPSQFRRVESWQGRLASVEFQTGFLGDLEVERDLAAYHRIHLARRHWRWLDALHLQFLLYVRKRQHLCGLGVETVDNRPWRLRGDQHAVPVVEVGVLVAGLQRGRYLRQAGRALGRADGQGHQLLVLDEGQPGRNADEDVVDAARHHFGERFRAAAEWHVRDLESGADVEPLRRPVGGAADAGRRKAEAAGLCLCHQLLHGVDAF